MNSKQRALAALQGKVPDRVPVWVTVVADLADRMAEVTCLPTDPQDAYLTNRISHAEMLTGLGTEMTGVRSNRDFRPIPEGLTIFRLMKAKWSRPPELWQTRPKKSMRTIPGRLQISCAGLPI